MKKDFLLYSVITLSVAITTFSLIIAGNLYVQLEQAHDSQRAQHILGNAILHGTVEGITPDGKIQLLSSQWGNAGLHFLVATDVSTQIFGVESTLTNGVILGTKKKKMPVANIQPGTIVTINIDQKSESLLALFVLVGDPYSQLPY